ncbi:hypothetical protein GF376_02995, partial [Candidatus Peregrinibacteria bacterium]|nr:hypothetical protein [Candidatus Peregrinibacteria bacterium]
MRKSTIVLSLLVVATSAASLVFAQPSGAPPDNNLPDATFNSIEFPNGTKMNSAFAIYVGATSLTNGNIGSYADANTSCANVDQES